MTNAPYEPLLRHAFSELDGLRADGFTIRRYGRANEPRVITAEYEWGPELSPIPRSYVDVAIIRSHTDIACARIYNSHDCFDSATMVWAYSGADENMARRALLELLTLPHPRHPDAPKDSFSTPATFRLRPEERQKPVAVRLPSPLTQGRRSARLAATLPADSRHRA